MKYSFIIYLILSIFPTLCHAQTVSESGLYTDDILKTKKFRKGVHQNFKEFRTNSPSDLREIKLEVKNKTIETYILRYPDGEKVKKVFAYSDGDFLYISANTYHSGFYFVKIQEYGKYLYFEDKVQRSGGGVAADPFTTLAIIALSETIYYTSNKKRGLILNINNGIVYDMHEKNLQALLSVDPELKESFELAFKKKSLRQRRREDTGKKKSTKQYAEDVKKEYLLRFNERNMDKIKPPLALEY